MFQIQVLPQGQCDPIHCNVSNSTIANLTSYCTQQLGCDVVLYSDQNCTRPLTPYYTLQQCGIQNGSVIYAKIDQMNSSAPYCDVTCWLIVDGQELQNGVVQRSDYTFEEVLSNAIDQGFLNFMPNCIEVTNQQGQGLTSLMEIQMFKLIPEGSQNAEFYIHFTSNGQPPQINLQSFLPNQLQQQPPPFYPPTYMLPQQPPYYLKPTFQGIQQSQYQEQQIIKNISQQSIQDIQMILNSMIVMPFVTLLINQQGTQVAYKYHSPIQVQGYFTEQMGQKKQKKPDYDWQTRNGIEYAQYNKNGFIIRWKNDTYNAMRLQLIT